MPISSRKLGPGTLTLGAGLLDVSAQLAACRVATSETVERGDSYKVLTGEVLAGDETVTHSETLSGKFLQDDPGATSVVDWSHDNNGTTQPFVFVPNTIGAREVTGSVRVVRLDAGGDEVETRMTSDFTWQIIADTLDYGTV